MMKVRSRIRAAALIIACLGAVVPARGGTLLPNGMQTFLDANGAPLASGCVYFYVPGSATAKNTYLDAAQTQLNTNPVQLDAGGRAIIYGTGVYRQLVKATPCGSSGVTVWDQLTTDTASSVTINAGASAGTPNAITVNAPAFTGTDGQVISFISTNTNTGGSTLNPSGFGAIQIVRDSSTGPSALTGGELVATNSVSVIYDATAGTFHILSPVTWPNTSGVPVGAVISVAGFAAPANFAFAYGQAVSRITYASLLTALTSAQTGTLASGSPTITALSDTTQFGAGQAVEATGIPAGATIVSCAATTCTLSANATATRTGTMTFYAYGNGDGSTTFNLPDYRGRALAGRDNMGGSAAGLLTSTYYGVSPTMLGGPGGAQSSTLVAGNLPPVTSTNAAQAISVTTSATNIVAGTVASALVGSGVAADVLQPGTGTNAARVSTGNNSISVTSTGTTSTPVSRVPPAAIVNWAVRLVP